MGVTCSSATGLTGSSAPRVHCGGPAVVAVAVTTPPLSPFQLTVAQEGLPLTGVAVAGRGTDQW